MCKKYSGASEPFTYEDNTRVIRIRRIKPLDGPDVIALWRIGGVVVGMCMGRLLDSFACRSCCLLMAGSNGSVCTWQESGSGDRYEDGQVSTHAFFSVRPSAYLLRKARPLGHSSMCSAHSAGKRVGTCAGHSRSSTEVSGC
jgi:hypothetical protein